MADHLAEEKKLSLWQMESLRYRSKGLGNILIAVILYVPFYYFWYALEKYLWITYHPQIMAFDHKNFIMVGAGLIHTITALTCLLVLLPNYLGYETWLSKYRIPSEKSWMWERSEWKDMLPKIVRGLLKSHLLYFPVLMLINSPRMKISFGEYPSFGEFYLQSMFILLVDDLFFFLTHIMLHIPWFYKHIHKQHHENDTSFSIVSEYAHPVEYLLSNFVTEGVAMFILGSRLHISTYFFYVVLKVMITNEVHSGYEVHWNPIRVLPFVNGASCHNFHHSHNVGAYGGYTYTWDYLTGNLSQYLKYHYSQLAKKGQ